MGWNLSIVAVQSGDRANVLETLGLEDQEYVDREPWSGRDKISVTRTPAGWVVIWANGGGFFSRTDLEAVSALGATLAWTLVETVNVSEIRSFEQGRELWAVVCDPENDPGLQIKGDPPPPVRAICTEFLARQAKSDEAGEDVDELFDAPVDIAEALCGFRHDADQVDGLEFSILYEAKPRRKEPGKKGGPLSWLFGRF